jgi:hypothetical protein
LERLQATAALKEILSQEDTEALAKESYAAIFTALMTRLGACAGLKAEKVGFVDMKARKGTALIGVVEPVAAEGHLGSLQELHCSNRQRAF